jgi:hypothetical protein
MGNNITKRKRNLERTLQCKTKLNFIFSGNYWNNFM